MAKQSYVYRTTNPTTGEFYIGSRTVPYGLARSDVKYFGSGVWPKQMKMLKVLLHKEVIKVCNKRAKARTLEMWLIYQEGDNQLCRNIQYWQAPPRKRRPLRRQG